MPASSPLNYSCRDARQPNPRLPTATGPAAGSAGGTDFAVASTRQVVFNAQLFNPSADGLIVLHPGPYAGVPPGDVGRRRARIPVTRLS